MFIDSYQENSSRGVSISGSKDPISNLPRLSSIYFTKSICFLNVCISDNIPFLIRWYLIILICISLITSDKEHFFINLLAIWITSSRKCLFSIFDEVIGGFSCLRFMTTLYILDFSPLFDVWCENIFSYSAVSFSISWIFFDMQNVLNLK